MDGGEEWFTFRNGVTPAVARIIEECDRERLAVVRAFGLEARTVADWMRRYYPDHMAGADFLEMMSSSPVFARSLGPRRIQDRFLREDVPYGLAPISAIARTLDLATPCTDGVVALASVVGGEDFARSGRTLERLGFVGLDRDAVIAKMAQGS